MVFYSENEDSKLAYVTFKDLQGAETAILLTVNFIFVFYSLSLNSMSIFSTLFHLSQGATIVDSSVTVTMSPDYQLPPDALATIVSNS